MRILIVPAVDWFTALENRVHHLARVWRRRHELHVVHFPLGGQALRGNEGDVIHRLYNARSSSLLTYYLVNFIPQMVQILRIIRRERVDLVVTTGLSAGTAAIIVSKISRTPLIFDYCDYLPAFSRYAGATGIVENFLRWIGELLTVFNLRVADASVAIGERLRRHAQTRSLISHEIPNGVDASRFEEPGSWEPAEYPVLGYVGVLEFFVDLGSAIDSLEKLPGSRLVIVGDGRERENLEEYARSRELDQRVEFVGRVPYDQIGRWITSMDVCLLPFESSELTEAALPLKIHEYSALHRPIVSSPLFEVVRMYGSLLYLATGADGISGGVEAILDRRVETLKKVHRAYLRATRTYNWDRFGSRYEKVFLRAAGRTGEEGDESDD
jgi:glycosyltransferase involved in cell wall biosynthesis